jgi:CheY-like chemotaxis protein
MARILVVEDNPQNLKLTGVILKSEGHLVVPALNAGEAERAIAEGIPELILMDLALPGKDGYTLTRELRSRSETAQVPILAVSAFALPGDADRALAAGCSAYLSKPIRRAALLELVGDLLGARAVPAELSPAPSDAVGAAVAGPPRTLAAATPATPVLPASDPVLPSTDEVGR